MGRCRAVSSHCGFAPGDWTLCNNLTQILTQLSLVFQMQIYVSNKFGVVWHLDTSTMSWYINQNECNANSVSCIQSLSCTKLSGLRNWPDWLGPGQSVKLVSGCNFSIVYSGAEFRNHNFSVSASGLDLRSLVLKQQSRPEFEPIMLRHLGLLCGTLMANWLECFTCNTGSLGLNLRWGGYNVRTFSISFTHKMLLCTSDSDPVIVHA